MLESMQERQVSIGGTINKLPSPFFVLATQNPLEQEGTYPLPEAQQDRFIFKIFVDYPESHEETEIVRRVAEHSFGQIERVCSGDQILAAQGIVRDIPVADAVIDYANNLVRATRPEKEGTSDLVRNYIAWGAGPRATINLAVAGKCFAALAGNPSPSCDDVARAALPVMRHRLGLNYTAKAEGLTTDQLVTQLLEIVPKY